MEDKFLVELGDYKILNEDDPIGYVRDIHTCIAILIHKDKYSALLHVESYQANINIDNFARLLRNEDDNQIKDIDIFVGEHTSIGNLSIIKFILHKLKIHYNIYNIFENLSKETSVGYNFLTHDYYMVEMDKGKPTFIRKLIK